ncbi:MAG: hypothetical protein KC643_25305, partial [Nitrospira sp.]|nr:hypothetical protein [Nitrospira sp.]
MEISRLSTAFIILGFTLVLAGFGLPLFLPKAESWSSLLLTGGGLLLSGYFALHIRTLASLTGSRSARLGVHSIFSVILAATIVALCNFLAARHAPEWDFSETQNFTLSHQTYEVLRKLPRAVTIKVFSH